jgi:hypothetical protein
MLTLRPTGLSWPAYQDWPDYTVIEDGRAAGRVYEDRYTRPELRWFLVNHNPAVTSALASGLLYLSQPTLAPCVSTSRSCRFCCKSLVQNDVQQGITDLDFSVVLDKTQFAEFVHEKAHARPGRADHFGSLRDWHRPIAKGRPGAMPSDLWDKLPECSGSIHHLRD